MKEYYRTYLPHTEADIREMLQSIGINSVEQLFRDIPETVRLTGEIDIPSSRSESEILDYFITLGERNKQLVCFAGGGSYDHIIPSAVDHILSRTEFTTAYTPYQAEISQGILKAIFEYQSMICRLTDLDVSNASLYDGHTAAAEAVSMAINSKRKSNTVLYSAAIHPYTKDVLNTFFRNTGIVLKEVPQEDYITCRNKLKKMITPDVAGVIIQTPNFYGFAEQIDDLAEYLHEHKVLLMLSVNPMSLSIMKTPGEYGADVAFGDIQSLGLPMNFGGPSGGFIAADSKYLRKMPGRIVGETIDNQGKRAFVLTLQAREQHIKRERATSNICSNQALMALGSTVYMTLLGKEGFIECGQRNYQHAHYFLHMLTEELPVLTISDVPFFNEFTIELPIPAEDVVEKMCEKGIFAGIPLSHFSALKDDRRMIIAVTEKRTPEEMKQYINTMKEILT